MPTASSLPRGRSVVARFGSMKWTFLDHPVPFVFAHQGGRDVAPGNTEAAFEHADSLGYRYFETDVQATADGVLVVFHDDDLENLTGVPGAVVDQSWEELSQLRVGGEHPIPRFEDLVEGYPHIRFNVEPKNDEAVDLLAELIRRQRMQSRICVGSFSDRRLAQFKRRLASSRVCTSPGPLGVALALAAAVVGWPRPWRRHGALQIPASVGPLSLTGRWLIDRVHKLGLQVHVWTINDEPEMVRLLDNGVDAIMTDELALARRVLEDRGQWTP